MIEAILPAYVKAAEIIGAVDITPLPEEAEMLGRAVEKRVREFAAGRECARRALAQLGIASVPILRGPDREPIWPSGIAGSITHCLGYCAAAVADVTCISGVGIDAEVDAPLPDGVLRRVATDAEREMLSRLPAGQNWDRLLFSAKECVYKAEWPRKRVWIGFEDAEIVFDPEAGVFTARGKAPHEFSLHGRFLVGQGFVLTAIVTP